MPNEKERIVKLLEDGKITADDAAKLLAALGGDESGSDARGGTPPPKDKKLRCVVEIEGDENVNINLALPLEVAKIAEGIISSIIPDEAAERLETRGIHIKTLDLGAIVGGMTGGGSGDDIINVKIEGDEDIRVKVYMD